MSLFDPKKFFTVAVADRMIRNYLSSEYGEGEARAMSRLIFHHLKGWSATDMIIHADMELSEYALRNIESVLVRLSTGEPLQYILGQARFYGMDLKVSPSVLIPRTETEELVDLIVKRYSRTDDLRVLDIGTGSGAIAIALSRNLPYSKVTAIDISPEPLGVAEENARQLKARIDFFEKDIFLYEPAPASFDIIVSNPPYIVESERGEMMRNVLEHEPHLALFVSDSDPTVYYSRIVCVASRSLVGGGRLYFEINPLFADRIEALLRHEGFDEIEIINDISHRPRFAVAVRPLEKK